MIAALLAALLLLAAAQLAHAQADSGCSAFKSCDTCVAKDCAWCGSNSICVAVEAASACADDDYRTHQCSMPNRRVLIILAIVVIVAIPALIGTCIFLRKYRKRMIANLKAEENQAYGLGSTNLRDKYAGRSRSGWFDGLFKKNNDVDAIPLSDTSRRPFTRLE